MLCLFPWPFFKLSQAPYAQIVLPFAMKRAALEWPQVTLISASILYSWLYHGMRQHSIMLHWIVRAHGLGDVLCNLPCQYPLLMCTAVKRVLPADWMLLNLKCNTDSFHILPVLLSFQASVFHSGFLEHVANKYCTPRRCTDKECGEGFPHYRWGKCHSTKAAMGGTAIYSSALAVGSCSHQSPL